MKRFLLANPFLSGVTFVFLVTWSVNYKWQLLDPLYGVGGIAAILLIFTLLSEIYTCIKFKDCDKYIVLYYAVLLSLTLIPLIIGGVLQKNLWLFIYVPLMLFVIIHLFIKMKSKLK